MALFHITERPFHIRFFNGLSFIPVGMIGEIGFPLDKTKVVGRKVAEATCIETILFLCLFHKCGRFHHNGVERGKAGYRHYPVIRIVIGGIT